MKRNDSIIYDPEPTDPTDYQIELYGESPLVSMEVSEMANEQSVKLILHQLHVTLRELREKKIEINSNQNEISELRETCEKLKIKLAESASNAGIDIASILISLLGGFAVNMVSATPTDPMGWVIFILCIATVITFKASVIYSFFSKKKNNS